jgi:putative cofactor-binding repeat protein
MAIFGVFSNQIANAQGLSTNKTYVVNGASDYVAPVDTFVNLTGPNSGNNYGALTYLNQYGMLATQSGNGAVVFLLSSGYNPIEPTVLNIGQTTGSGGWPNMYWNANSPIVIKPAAGQNFNITTSSTIGANQALVRFNGAWFASIDGAGTPGQRNLTFYMPTNATQTSSRVIDFMPTSGQPLQYVGIKNCRIIGNSNTATIYTHSGIYLGGVTSGSATAIGQSQNIDVVNNEIMAVQNGIYFRGLANNRNLQNRFINILNNTIGGYVNPINSANLALIGGNNASGIYLNAVSSAVVSGNTIRNTLPTLAANYKGIFLTNEGGAPGLSLDSNIQITNNKIYNINTTITNAGVTGIRVSLATHTQHLRLLIANNSIAKLSATASQASINGFNYPIGILIDNVTSNVGAEVFFNSIYLSGSSIPNGGFSACFATGTGTTGGIYLMNNAFSNTMGRTSNNINGYSVYGVLATNTTAYPFEYSSFNNYYITTFDGGNAFVSKFKNIDITSLKGLAMRNRSDSTSYSTIPPFNNDTVLTVNAGVSHFMYNGGANLTKFFSFYQSIFDSIRFKVNYDINGTLRNASGRFTSIGCHAWAGDSTNNNIALVGPRTFIINGYSQWPKQLNQNGYFSTIAEAVNYLNQYGVGGSGNIVFELQPGYNGETDYIPTLIDYPNSNLGTPVIFRPQTGFSTTVTVPNVAAMNNLSVLSFAGANHVTFDGGPNKSLTFSLPVNATNINTRVIGITPFDTVSTSITIKNCKIIGNSTTAIPNTQMGIYVGHPLINGGNPVNTMKDGVSNISFIGNEIQAVKCGIVVFSSGSANNMLIKSNIIGGTIAPGTSQLTTYIGGAANMAGIRIKGVSNCTIDSNVIRNCVPTTNVSNAFSGIWLDEAGAPMYASVNITRNFIYNLATTNGTFCAGIRTLLSNEAGSRGISMSNNFIGRIVGNGTGLNFSNLNPAGILIDAAAANTDCGIAIAHNTIHLTGTGLGANNSGSAALFLGANIRGGIELDNNILGNELSRTSASGSRYAVLVGHNASPFTTANILPFGSNNNNYFANGNGNNYVGANTNGSVVRLNINDWRAFTAATSAGEDGSSFNWVNTFVTDTTPDIDLLYGGLVPGGASIVTGICNDIYGNARYLCAGGSSTITRWVGAVEKGMPYPALQGNVTYAINGVDNPPTPTSPNSGSFKTVRNAIDYLNSQGVDDPNFGGFRTVKLEISNGYIGETDTFTRPITILDYPRQANTRPVVLTVASGRSDTIRFTSNVNAGIAANMSAIRFSGCKYFTIDGNNGSGQRNLTIVLPTVFTANTNKVVDFISGTTPITATSPSTENSGIKNCNIIGSSTTNAINTFAGVYMGGLVTPSNAYVGMNNNNIVQNNFIGAVRYGVYFRGESDYGNIDRFNTISGNIIGGSIAPNTTGNTNYFGGVASAAGIFVAGQANITISGNTINNNLTNLGSPRGIEIATIPGLYPKLGDYTTINGNIIKNIQTTVSGAAYGIYVNFGNDNANVNREITISNNMISGIASPGSSAVGTGFRNNPFGIYLDATANIGSGNTWVGVYLYYNSINLGVDSKLTVANSVSACLGIPSYIQSGVISQNNIFQNRLGGTGSGSRSYGVAIGSQFSPLAISNYNNYYTASTTTTIASNFGSNANSTTPSTYNEWYEIMDFTTQDTMSLTTLTPFTNDNNLFIPNATASNLYQAGKALFNVTTDINGNGRNSFQPSLGAHEFTGTYVDNIAPRIFNVTDPTACQSGAIILNFNIYDKQLIGDSLYYKINGGSVQNIQASFTSGTFRRFILPAQPGGTLVEYRLTAYDYPTPPNTGYFPAGKPWDTLSTGINSFPYVNGFEGVNNPIWRTQSLSGGADWEIGVSGSATNPPQAARSGIKSVMFASSNYPIAGSSARLVSPCLDFSNLKSPTLRFYMSQNNGLPNKQDSIAVKVSFGGNIWSNPLRTVTRYNPDYPLPGYTLVEVCLAAYQTSGLRIAIEAYGAGSGNNIQLDDIMIYDDVQTQTFSPKVFSQCFRDSVQILINNPDERFQYRVVNLANGTTFNSKMGDGTSMYLGFEAPVVDTLRYFVEASNMVSQAINTGFGGGYITCSNVMPDTLTAYINRFYNGPFITAGLPFNGSYNTGDVNNPDGAKVGDTITYRFVPPAFYTNANYGTLWSIPTVTAYAQASGNPITNFTFVAPSGSNAGYVRIIAPANMLDSNIIFNFKIRINASGCDSSFTRVLRVSVPPTANFDHTPATNLCANNTIQFSALSSTKPANNFPFNFNWNFGDGTFDFVENPSKVYSQPGTYTVTFTLSDRYGISSVKTEVITILPSPSVNFTTSIPCATDSTVFTPSTQPAGSSFLWTFPNSTTQTREVSKYNFAKYDTAYDVTLKVTNSSGCFLAVKKNIYVFAKPTANFATAPHCLSNVVPITNTSTIPVGNMGFNWKWGNGETSLSMVPTYKYPASGTYSATLTVTSSFGCTDTMVKTITVYDRPFANYTVDNKCVGQNDLTTFTNTTGFPGGLQNVDYTWTFGDNSSPSSVQSPAHRYLAVGNYTVFLLAVDKINGCRDSVTRNIATSNKPVAQFATSPENGTCENNELQVINSSYTIDGTAIKCNFTWGDGNTDTICAVTGHTYAGHGFYTITLITTTPNGCSDTATKDITINQTPGLSLTVTDVDVASYPYCKNKKAMSASIADGVSYEWKMGDAGNSTRSGKDIEFVYPIKGKYTVTCTVIDANGCTVVAQQPIDSIWCNVGIEDNLAAAFDLNAYPNPFGETTTLSFDLPKGADVNVTIMDVLGRTIKTNNLGRLGAGKHTQTLADFGSAGTYLVKVEIDGNTIYKQVIKQ